MQSSKADQYPKVAMATGMSHRPHTSGDSSRKVRFRGVIRTIAWSRFAAGGGNHFSTTFCDSTLHLKVTAGKASFVPSCDGIAHIGVVDSRKVLAWPLRST